MVGPRWDQALLVIVSDARLPYFRRSPGMRQARLARRAGVVRFLKSAGKAMGAALGGS